MSVASLITPWNLQVMALATAHGASQRPCGWYALSSHLPAHSATSVCLTVRRSSENDLPLPMTPPLDSSRCCSFFARLLPTRPAAHQPKRFPNSYPILDLQNLQALNRLNKPSPKPCYLRPMRPGSVIITPGRERASAGASEGLG